ncbi:MAG: VCBS repeat-containing protein [Anaerolineae bacterium]|jgi:hypothetical protein|nr:VCBS repeat-containing protein [Anaerolineae bacterium]
MQNTKWFVILVVIVLLAGCNSPSSQPPADEAAVEPAAAATAKPTKEKKAPTATLVEQSLTDCVPKFTEMADSIVYISGAEEDMGIESIGRADFNDDGHFDLLITRIVFATSIDSPMELLLNDGTGLMRIATEEMFPGGTPTAQHPAKLLLEDFNGDGVTDAYIADSGMDSPPWPGNPNTLLLSQPGGTMIDASNTLPQHSDQTHRAATADVDQDGDMDVYVVNLGQFGNYLLENDGAGNFTINNDALPYEAKNNSVNWYTTAGFGDLNNDGYPELIGGQGDPNKSSHIYWNDGFGKFSTPPVELPSTPLGVNQLALDVNAVDINEDGWLDIVMVYTTNEYTARYIQVLLNDGTGQVEDQTDAHLSLPPSGNWIRFVKFFDINNDGHLDFLAAQIHGSPILYINDGSGNFKSKSLNFDLFEFAIADFNKDGWLDLMNSGGTMPEFHSTFISQGCP